MIHLLLGLPGDNIRRNPFIAAKRGYIDDIIEPARSRFRIIKALQLVKNKRDHNPKKKHGNIPL